MRRTPLILMLTMCWPALVWAEPTAPTAPTAPTEASAGHNVGLFESEDGPVDVTLQAEVGFLAPMSHVVQFSTDGSLIDYIDEGGQDNLFFFGRLSTILTLFDNHEIVLLYQPLALESSVTLERDLSIDGETFPAGTGVDFLYGFPFWRAAYAYDFIDSPKHKLAFGGGLQIRNATINFRSTDGTRFRSNRDIGPVPLLRLVGRYGFETAGLFLETEVDGFYAPIKYINGGDSDVEGAIIDWSIRAGLELDAAPGEVFLNVRYLGGGAEGTSSDDDGPGDGFNKNWLHFMTISLGASVDIL